MKKVIVLAASMLLLAFQAHAQLQADGGYMHAMETHKIYNSLSNTTSTYPATLDGAYFGALYNISLDNLVDGLSVVPGANVSFLFGKYYNDKNVNVQEIALNIPVYGKYTFNISDNFGLFGYFGPVAQIGLVQKGTNTTVNPAKVYNYYKSTSVDAVIADVEIIPARRPFNLYLEAGIGAKIANAFTVSAGYDLGLMNMSTGANIKIHRGAVKIGIGYIF